MKPSRTRSLATTISSALAASLLICLGGCSSKNDDSASTTGYPNQGANQGTHQVYPNQGATDPSARTRAAGEVNLYGDQPVQPNPMASPSHRAR